VAYRELVRWIDQETGMGKEEADMLPTIAGKARLGNRVDPKYTIGTGIAKSTSGCDGVMSRHGGLALARLACTVQSLPQLQNTRQTLQGVYHARWQQHAVTSQHRCVGIHQQRA
jgi:hypothetical protein